MSHAQPHRGFLSQFSFFCQYSPLKCTHTRKHTPLWCVVLELNIKDAVRVSAGSDISFLILMFLFKYKHCSKVKRTTTHTHTHKRAHIHSHTKTYQTFSSIVKQEPWPYQHMVPGFQTLLFASEKLVTHTDVLLVPKKGKLWGISLWNCKG